MSDAYRDPYERYDAPKTRYDRIESIAKILGVATIVGCLGVLASAVHGCVTKPDLCKSDVYVLDSLTYENTHTNTRGYQCAAGADLELLKDPMNPMIVYAVCTCKSSKDLETKRLGVVDSMITMQAMPSASSVVVEKEVEIEDK